MSYFTRAPGRAGGGSSNTHTKELWEAGRGRNRRKLRPVNIWSPWWMWKGSHRVFFQSYSSPLDFTNRSTVILLFYLANLDFWKKKLVFCRNFWSRPKFRNIPRIPASVTDIFPFNFIFYLPQMYKKVRVWERRETQRKKGDTFLFVRRTCKRGGGGGIKCQIKRWTLVSFASLNPLLLYSRCCTYVWLLSSSCISVCLYVCYSFEAGRASAPLKN